jgi:Ras-related protein Rab-1A
LKFINGKKIPKNWYNEYQNDWDSSDEGPTEEKDNFVDRVYKCMDDLGTPLNKKIPSINNSDVDLFQLFRAVQKLGGYNRVTSHNKWTFVALDL